MTDPPSEAGSWTRSPWAKWSWLLLLGVIVAQSLDYHCRRLPTTAAGYFARGRADYLLGEYESAVGNFTRSIDLAPKEAEAYIWRGEAYVKLGDFALAVPDIEEALTLRPDYAKSHAALADLKAATWDTEGAIAAYSKAIALEPNYPRCYLERGKMLYDAGRWAEATSDLRRAASTLIADNQTTARLFLWVARARSGDAAGATAELARVATPGARRRDRLGRAARFLAGEVSEAAYLAPTTVLGSDPQSPERAEACFLAGAKRILAGDQPGALLLLRQSLQTDADESYAYGRAREELASLLPGFHPMRIDATRLSIASVNAGSAAEAAGIRPGSILASIGGVDANQDAFISFLQSAAPGSTVELTIIDQAGSRSNVPLALRFGSSAPTK
jgi:tetratricopeptide (TPR) repeat protein